MWYNPPILPLMNLNLTGARLKPMEQRAKYDDRFYRRCGGSIEYKTPDGFVITKNWDGFELRPLYQRLFIRLRKMLGND